jgi:ribosomal protein S18 acetylase RimI-like enzyme
MDYNIRSATMDDLEDVKRLWRELSYDQLSHDEYYSGDFEFDGNDQYISALSSTDCQIFVAEINNNIVGFIEVWLYSRDFHFFIDDYAYILHLYIDETARKQNIIWGLIFKLFRECENWAILHGRKYLVSDVFNHNQRMMRILERLKHKRYRCRFVKTL